MRLPLTRLARTRLVATACAALALTLLPSQGHSQNVMNLLNSLGGGGNAGGILGAVTGGGGAAQGDDLISMLSRSVDSIDEPREAQIGRQLAAVLLGSKPLHPDMALQRYVNQLGRWISLQSERPHLPWTFVVLDDPGYNAFAAPGGYVFVTKGLIDRCADEAELAGILAHEIIHVTAKHHLHAMRKTAQSGLLTQLVASQIKTNAVGNMVASQFLALGRNLYARGLDQTDEYDADRSGVALATRAGFDPYGLVAVLQQLRTATPDNPMFSLALATHPPAQTRLDQLELAMGKNLDAFTGAAPITVAQRLSNGAPSTAAAPAAKTATPPAAAPARKPPPPKKKEKKAS
ncbi:MAG: M48 family metalloprotease [Gammaproteobacteria bacterium]|jgi:predicted Zn-dependent protease|nr:M48 family metalloprotease [Gammaproteobacteria bacterium]MBU0828151.1 M48 family metalloprotease [Gammaproteobacteria bacterium]MBU0892571.1 M48 family metalloprotease [Gammaproteobacteria bacterium]MBU1350876.1 M48 family metalloprotease [Gammaproteobacteria bacterium]MBU1504652.1 M48 family metalloprotease [Gammaproteobacteria bacterium]